jgi:hypothetical protein
MPGLCLLSVCKTQNNSNLNRMNKQIINAIVRKSLIPEIILILMVLTGYLLFAFKNQIGGSIFMVSISALSIIYFIRGLNEHYNYEASFNVRFIGKIANLGLSIALIGILFSVMKYSDAKRMILMGSMSVLLGLVCAIYLSLKYQIPNVMYLILRCILVGGVSLILYLDPVFLH